MKKDWLWDRDLNIEEIFGDEKHPRYISTAALLLARKNSAKEVFSEYIKPLVFYKNWLKIKKLMRQDQWNNPRIDYWQAIYEKLGEKYKAGGLKLRQPKMSSNKLIKNIGQQIKAARIKKGFTQKKFATHIGITQQWLSKIEKGQENITLLTLIRLCRALGMKEVNFPLKSAG